MAFVLMDWLDDPLGKYSVVKKSEITDGELRKKPRKFLLGKVVWIHWKERPYKGKIVNVGAKKELDEECDELLAKENQSLSSEAESADKENAGIPAKKHKVGKKRLKALQTSSQILNVLEQMDSQDIVVSEASASIDVSHTGKEDPMTITMSKAKDAPLMDENPSVEKTPAMEMGKADSMDVEEADSMDMEETDSMEVEEVEKVEEVAVDRSSYDAVDYEAEIHALEEKYTRLKKKYKALKKQSGDANVELVKDSKVFIKRCHLNAIEMLSKRPTFLARNLFRRLFSEEDLRTHSLFGNTCNANKEKTTLPEIDPQRRDAVIKFILIKYNLATPENEEASERAQALHEKITKTLGDFLREQRNPKKKKSFKQKKGKKAVSP